MPKVQLPYINPVKLVDQDLIIDNKYHLRPLDTTLYKYQIYDFQEDKDYFQKYQTGDIIYFQLISEFGAPTAVRLINCNGDIIILGTSVAIPNNFYTVPKIAYGCTIDTTGVTTGYYYVQVLVGIRLISEPIYIDTDIPNSIVFQYSYKKNYYGAIFQNGETFNFRCEAILTDFQPGANEIVYEDQIADLVRLSSRFFRSNKLIIGDAFGVPDWVADKINRIFGMDKVLLDTEQFVRPEGAKMERNGNRLYPMAGWTLEVREVKSNNGVTIESSLPVAYDAFMIIPETPMLFGDLKSLNTNANIEQIK